MRPTPISRASFGGVLVALVTACSSSTSTTSTTASSSAPGASSAPAAGSGGIIKIGVDLPVSGADAAIGVPTQNGAVLAIEAANKSGFTGGVFKLEASLLDDAVQGKHDPAAGAQNVKTFIADNAVLAMVGPFNSNVAKSEIPLTNDAGLAQISPSNTNDGLTVGADAKKLRTAHPDTNAYFRVCTKDSRQGGALAQFAQKLGFKKVFIIDDNETYGKGLADSFEAAYKGLGGTVLGHEWIDDAFLGNEPLAVYDNALTWLRGGCRGVVVLDCQAAPLLLREAPALVCESPATARRLTEAFERPRPHPPVLVHTGEKQ